TVRSPLHDPVHQPVVQCFLGTHPLVPVGVNLNLFKASSTVSGQYLRKDFLDTDDLLSLDLDVTCLPLDPPERLVDHHPRVRQNVPLVLVTVCKKDCGRRCGHSHTGGRDRTSDILYCVVEREPCGDHATRAVDVKVDMLFRIP